MLVVPRAVQDSPYNISAKFTVAHRLVRENGFDHVIHAENIVDGQFKIFFVRNDKNNARLGIIVSKRMLSRAVDRNRAKRTIREVFRQHNIKMCKLDLIVMIRRHYVQENRAQVEKLRMLFSRAENRCAEL